MISLILQTITATLLLFFFSPVSVTLQVVTFIHTNGHLLFSPTAKSQAKPTKQSPAGTDVGSTLPVVSDDYDYVNLESKDKFDQDNEEVKRTLPSEMKPAFDVLMAQSETLPVLPTIDQVCFISFSFFIASILCPAKWAGREHLFLMSYLSYRCT